MKIKAAELTGSALDWAVAKCEEAPWPYERKGCRVTFHPSTDWSQGGPIIERENICLKREAPCMPDARWSAWVFPGGTGHSHGSGPTPLIAAMRCYVAAKLGDEVDVPEELL